MSGTTKAYQLTGTTLPGGWLLKEMYVRERGDATGGQCSVQYNAERNGVDYFVKVIDIERTLRRINVA